MTKEDSRWQNKWREEYYRKKRDDGKKNEDNKKGEG